MEEPAKPEAKVEPKIEEPAKPETKVEPKTKSRPSPSRKLRRRKRSPSRRTKEEPKPEAKKEEPKKEEAKKEEPEKEEAKKEEVKEEPKPEAKKEEPEKEEVKKEEVEKEEAKKSRNRTSRPSQSRSPNSPGGNFPPKPNVSARPRGRGPAKRESVSGCASTWPSDLACCCGFLETNGELYASSTSVSLVRGVHRGACRIAAGVGAARLPFAGAQTGRETEAVQQGG